MTETDNHLILKELKQINQQLALLNNNIQASLFAQNTQPGVHNIVAGPTSQPTNTLKDIRVGDIGKEVKEAIKKAQADVRAQIRLSDNSLITNVNDVAIDNINPQPQLNGETI